LPQPLGGGVAHISHDGPFTPAIDNGKIIFTVKDNHIVRLALNQIQEHVFHAVDCPAESKSVHGAPTGARQAERDSTTSGPVGVMSGYGENLLGAGGNVRQDLWRNLSPAE
jgi:hypothetical protein